MKLLILLTCIVSGVSMAASEDCHNVQPGKCSSAHGDRCYSLSPRICYDKNSDSIVCDSKKATSEQCGDKILDSIINDSDLQHKKCGERKTEALCQNSDYYCDWDADSDPHCRPSVGNTADYQEADGAEENVDLPGDK